MAPAGPAAVAFNITKEITATSETEVNLTLTAENIREMFTDTGVTVNSDITVYYWNNGGRRVLTTSLPETGNVFTFTIKSVVVSS